MPPRPGLAAPRFYRSSYQWTVLTSDANRTAGQCVFHTTAWARQESVDTSRPLIRKICTSHELRNVGIGASKGGSGGEARRSDGQTGSGLGSGLDAGLRHFVLNTTPDPSTAKVNRHYINGPVLSPSEKVFNSFKSRQQVVRYRSPEGIMVELAMPDDGLRKARAKWGQDVKGISIRSGARVEVQNISALVGDGSEDRIHSVLISGTFAQVSGAVNLLSSQYTTRSTTVHSQEALPSNTILPWQLVLRGRDRSQDITEMRIPEEDWASLPHLKDLARSAMDEGVALEVEIVEGTSQVGSHQGAPVRSLLMKGALDSAKRFCDGLASKLRNVKKVKIARASPAASAGTNVTSTGSFKEDRWPSSATRSDINAPTGHEVAKGDDNVAQTSSCGNGSSQSSETPIWCKVGIVGKDAFHPGLADAIWREIGHAPPHVTICRAAELDKTINQWDIEVFGPSSAVALIRTQITAVVDRVQRRFELKNVTTKVSESAHYKYVLTVTGDAAMSIRAEILADTSLRRKMTQSFGAKVRLPAPSSKQWRLKLVSKPQLIEKVQNRLQGFLRLAGKRLGANDFKTTLDLDTLDIILPTAGSAQSSAEQSVIHGELSGIQLKSSADTMRQPPQTGPKLAAAEQKVGQEQQEGMQTWQKWFVTPPAILQPYEPLDAEPQGIQAIQLGGTPEQCSLLAKGVRASLRSLTHPVVLITSQLKAGTADASPEQFARGVTVSSFNTVTLDPRPIVSFNLKVPSRSWDAISRSRKLRVHLLEASRRGAAVADVFTKPHDRPEAGFEELAKLGLDVRTDRPNESPIITDAQGAVLANFEARLLPDKCMPVDDHVVVLAEVTSRHARRGDKRDGLAYARRGYRACGEKIYPMEITTSTEGGPNDPLLLAAEGPREQSRTPLRADVDDEKISDLNASFEYVDDPIYNALLATKESAEVGDEVDIYAAMAVGDEGLGDETWSSQGGGQNSKPTSNSRRRRNFSQPSPLSAKRTFSTLAKFSGLERGFSSSAMAYRKDREDSHFVDPAAKTSTVADFLGVPDDNKRPHFPRVRSLLRSQKDIRMAERRLETEELSEDEAVALQSSVAHQQRIIARKLAWNAAGDLRLMLDKGNARVDFKRAQWLESAVEKGLTVLLDDARKLRQKREEGKVDAENYEMLRQKLETDHGVLQTELMRLREVADEDQDGGD